jgi:hypothetical protein
MAAPSQVDGSMSISKSEVSQSVSQSVW